MKGRFSGKVVLVTGAANGIGQATAEQFSAEGAHVIATDISIEGLEEQAGQIRDNGHLFEARKLDVTKRDEWAATMEDVVGQHGKLDVLVNNAGTSTLASFEDTTMEQWRRMMDVNLDGTFLGTQAGIAAMKERGGAIVNVASIAANAALPLLSAYNSTKGGVLMLTKSAAVECAQRGYGIRINSVHPGFTDTPMVHGFIDSLGADVGMFAKKTMKNIPMGRVARPREIAMPILFLASDDASYITGSELIVDGGFLAV